MRLCGPEQTWRNWSRKSGGNRIEDHHHSILGNNHDRSHVGLLSRFLARRHWMSLQQSVAPDNGFQERGGACSGGRVLHVQHCSVIIPTKPAVDSKNTRTVLYQYDPLGMLTSAIRRGRPQLEREKEPMKASEVVLGAPDWQALVAVGNDELTTEQVAELVEQHRSGVAHKLKRLVGDGLLKCRKEQIAKGPPTSFYATTELGQRVLGRGEEEVVGKKKQRPRKTPRGADRKHDSAKLRLVSGDNRDRSGETAGVSDAPLSDQASPGAISQIPERFTISNGADLQRSTPSVIADEGMSGEQPQRVASRLVRSARGSFSTFHGTVGDADAGLQYLIQQARLDKPIDLNGIYWIGEVRPYKVVNGHFVPAENESAAAE